MIRLFFRKKRTIRRMGKDNDLMLWSVMTFFLSAGILSALFYTSDPILAHSEIYLEKKEVFYYSLTKNSIVLFLFLCNAFSLLGFPLTAMLLFVCGHMICNASLQMFRAYDVNKIIYLVRSLPHISIQFIMFGILSKSVLGYSKNLILKVNFNRGKTSAKNDTIELFVTFLISMSLGIASALYEAYIL